MDMVKVLVDHSLGTMLCFCQSLFLFMIMNCIGLLCTSYVIDYGCYVMMMGIMDHYGP
jgi:hypothetical protein